jgi:leader peptidase (prepilin peptidase)/N-methyltransferase
MIRIFGTVLAGLLGLAFGSFLNVCLSRWPEGQSIVKPRSHCRNCSRTLTWWENLPILSWLALSGRCRTCNAEISWRYPAVELALCVLWAFTAWRVIPAMLSPDLSPTQGPLNFLYSSGLDLALGRMLLYWLLIALAMLDAESLWLPNWITIPGIALGILLNCAHFVLADWLAEGPNIGLQGTFAVSLLGESIAPLAAGGLSGALLSFGIGVVLGALFAFIALALPAARRESNAWLTAKLPLGTFLCIGGIISALWGPPIIDAYKRWAGF